MFGLGNREERSETLAPIEAIAPLVIVVANRFLVSECSNLVRSPPVPTFSSIAFADLKEVFS
ncbi:hypothetical protein U1Q18_010592, partial [Sarracenia purpurea var. burkii]